MSKSVSVPMVTDSLRQHIGRQLRGSYTIQFHEL